jgi:hypothetical protein
VLLLARHPSRPAGCGQSSITVLEQRQHCHAALLRRSNVFPRRRHRPCMSTSRWLHSGGWRPRMHGSVAVIDAWRQASHFEQLASFLSGELGALYHPGGSIYTILCRNWQRISGRRYACRYDVKTPVKRPLSALAGVVWSTYAGGGLQSVRRQHTRAGFGDWRKHRGSSVLASRRGLPTR